MITDMIIDTIIFLSVTLINELIRLLVMVKSKIVLNQLEKNLFYEMMIFYPLF